jgi:hypothetical protein
MPQFQTQSTSEVGGISQERRTVDVDREGEAEVVEREEEAGKTAITENRPSQSTSSMRQN